MIHVEFGLMDRKQSEIPPPLWAGSIIQGLYPLGRVVTGEAGIVKRDITYSGDVINTASRIRRLCKEFDVELIAPSDLVFRTFPGRDI